MSTCPTSGAVTPRRPGKDRHHQAAGSGPPERAHRRLVERLAALGLADQPVEPWEDVEDPAGGEDEAYVSCAKELSVLCAELMPRLT